MKTPRSTHGTTAKTQQQRLTRSRRPLPGPATRSPLSRRSLSLPRSSRVESSPSTTPLGGSKQNLTESDEPEAHAPPRSRPRPARRDQAGKASKARAPAVRHRARATGACGPSWTVASPARRGGHAHGPGRGARPTDGLHVAAHGLPRPRLLEHPLSRRPVRITACHFTPLHPCTALRSSSIPREPRAERAASPRF